MGKVLLFIIFIVLVVVLYSFTDKKINNSSVSLLFAILMGGILTSIINLVWALSFFSNSVK